MIINVTSTSARWLDKSTRYTEQQDEHCRDCEYFKRIDGPLGLEWGACCCQYAVWDGQLRNEQDGCIEHVTIPD